MGEWTLRCRCKVPSAGITFCKDIKCSSSISNESIGNGRYSDTGGKGNGKQRRSSAGAGATAEVAAFAGAAAPGLLATGSTDKTVKLWDVSGGGSTAPVCVESADLRVGAVFAMGFAGDDALPGVLAVAGAKGTVAVWEVGASDQVAERWAALAA